MSFSYDTRDPAYLTLDSGWPTDTNSHTNTQSQFSESPNLDIFSESYLPQLPLTINTASYEANLPSTALSSEKNKEIFSLIRDKLTGNKHTPAFSFQNNLLEGDPSQDYCVMSRHMMQEHINSYWMNFHSQLPICKHTTVNRYKRRLTEND